MCSAFGVRECLRRVIVHWKDTYSQRHNRRGSERADPGIQEAHVIGRGRLGVEEVCVLKLVHASRAKCRRARKEIWVCLTWP